MGPKLDYVQLAVPCLLYSVVSTRSPENENIMSNTSFRDGENDLNRDERQVPAGDADAINGAFLLCVLYVVAVAASAVIEGGRENITKVLLKYLI